MQLCRSSFVYSLQSIVLLGDIVPMLWVLLEGLGFGDFVVQ